jgi:VWFA-related protein
MVAATLVFLVSAPPLQAQDQQGPAQPPGLSAPGLVLRSQTNVVLVDVRVRQKGGKPVTDLSQKDFLLWEDDVQQNITSFSFEDVEKLSQAESSNSAPATIDLSKLPPNVLPKAVLQDRRLTVLFFDVSSMQPDDLTRALKAAQTFVDKRLTPADLVAIVSYTSSLRVLHDFTNDRAVLIQTIKSILVGEESSTLATAGSVGDAGGTNANGEEIVTQDISAAFTPDETEFNIFNTDQKLAAIESLSRMLRALPGRKSVIHFSSGVERTGSENQAQLRATIDAANQSNISLYTVDTHGLMALPPGGDATSATPSGNAIYTGSAISSQLSSLHGSRETLASLSQDTGGRTFYDLNDLGEAFEQIQNENSTYYLLGYSPINTRSDGKFRRIRVEVTRPGLKVEARPGYFAPKDFRQFTREDKERQLEQAMGLDQPFLDLPFVVDITYFRRTDQTYVVLFAAKIPGSSVSFLGKSGKHQTELDFVWRATDSTNKIAGILRDTLPVKVDESTFQELQGGNILYQGKITLAPGTYQLKTVVRENQSGKMGTFEAPLVLPDVPKTGMTLSSVVLSNEVKSLSSGAKSHERRGGQPEPDMLSVQGRAILPSVTRVFRNDQTLSVYLESYTPKPEAAAGGNGTGNNGEPSFALIFFSAGRKVAEAGPFPASQEKNASGKAIYYAEIPLTKIPVGRYMLQTNVINPVANLVGFARTPLAVVKPVPRPSPPGAGIGSIPTKDH